MGSANKEAKERYLGADITDIQFVPTEGKPNEITAQISEVAPIERIALGTPDQAIGRLRSLSYMNAAWSLTKIVGGMWVAIDGGGKLAANNLEPPIAESVTGGVEVAVGALVVTYSFINLMRRTNYLYAIHQSLVEKINTGVISYLDQTGKHSPESPKP